ncbi:MAG: MFS transporter, DHA1 family, bicyclomycin/chloramphenicol resistance protein [Rhodobacteraceae bacterium HLUCCA12]|nr:MAG: MFS transporter, DHA1 family, bicyclomycin/chloramphenicol resistance protein [Rhodobacteraceae bacterium HLUCCA12]
MSVAASPPPARRMPFGEFIALLALLLATVAFSIDAMLPLLSQMGAELAPASPADAQMVITVFVGGLGLGTFFAGPLSDRFGRRPVIVVGIALYMTAACIAALANSLPMLLFARFLQGLGAAGPRVVSQALVRDLYGGRSMARVMSFAMTIFVLVPAVAPLLGAQIGGLFGWRAIFWSFLIFGTVSALWLLIRQPETLAPEARRPLSIVALRGALAEVFGHRLVMLYLAALCFCFAPMFVWLSSVSLIFEQTYARGTEFPYWFALVAILSAPASLLNARLVMRLGMRRMVMSALLAQISMAVLMLFIFSAGLSATVEFPAFIAFMVIQFFCVGLLFGNLNALALEPMGHVAGMAASVMGGVSAIAAAIIATPVARAFDGTPVPLTIGALICALTAMGFMLAARRLSARDA